MKNILEVSGICMFMLVTEWFLSFLSVPYKKETHLGLEWYDDE